MKTERRKWWKNLRIILDDVLLLARSVASSFIDIYPKLLSRPKHRLKLCNYSRKLLSVDLSAKNSRLAFDSSILLPKNLQYQPKENLKLIYKIKNEIKNIFEDKRAVTKILKMDENNQYGNVMTKPLQTGSIKRAKKFPTMKEFDLILQGISDEDKIGHLFIVDTEFDQKNASEEQLFFKEIYTLIYEKKRCCLPMKGLHFNFLMQWGWMIKPL